MTSITAMFRRIGFLTFIALVAACQQSTDTEPVLSDYNACLKDVPSAINLDGGTALIGSGDAYPEERPVRQVEIAAFDIDASEVTNRQFAEFVSATGYVTDAEKIQPGFGVPGAAVFKPPSASQPNWWQFVEGANWRHPDGPDSSITGRDLDPVVQVSFNDAAAFAEWAGRRLPSEAEWEYAARAGSTTEFVWGDERAPNGVQKANTWQGAFPIQNDAKDGYAYRAPIGCYEPNNFGLYDMIGNAWEWTESLYQTGPGEPVYTIKGGSFLCAPNYCQRYRASAKQPQEAGFSTNHIGFRTVSKQPE